MTAPASERPALSVVPDPQPPTNAVPIQAARFALNEMLDTLGIETRPQSGEQTDALLALLLVASGADVTLPSQQIARRAQWLGAVAGYRMGAAS